MRAASGDSFVDGDSKSSSLAGDSTTSESLGPKSMAPMNAKGSNHARLPRGVLAHVGDEPAVVDSVRQRIFSLENDPWQNLFKSGGVVGVL